MKPYDICLSLSDFFNLPSRSMFLFWRWEKQLCLCLNADGKESVKRKQKRLMMQREIGKTAEAKLWKGSKEWESQWAHTWSHQPLSGSLGCTTWTLWLDKGSCQRIHMPHSLTTKSGLNQLQPEIVLRPSYQLRRHTTIHKARPAGSTHCWLVLQPCRAGRLCLIPCSLSPTQQPGTWP